MNGYNLWCIIFCCFGAFFYGYDSGFTTSIIAYPEFTEYYGFGSVTLGGLGSSYYGGQTIGSLLCFWYVSIITMAIRDRILTLHRLPDRV